MIYKNATMELICIDGEGKDEALFIEINKNELIKGIGVTWIEMSLGYGENVAWVQGICCGNINKFINKKT